MERELTYIAGRALKNEDSGKTVFFNRCDAGMFTSTFTARIRLLASHIVLLFNNHLVLCF